MKEGILISTLMILLLFNTYVAMVNPNVVSVLNQDLSGLVATALTCTIAAGINIFGSGLSDSATKIIFSVIVMFNILFQIDIYGFTLGLGLCSTVFTVFNNGDVLGIGTLIGGLLSFVAFFSAMLVVVESG